MVLVPGHVHRQVGTRVMPGEDWVHGLEQNPFGARHGVGYMSLQPHIASEIQLVAYQAVTPFHLRDSSRHLKLQLAEAELGITQAECSPEVGGNVLNVLIAGPTLGPAAERIDLIVYLVAGE